MSTPSESAPLRFSGKVALVTGASDRGIGGAIVERLSKEGASIVIANRHEPKRVLKRLERLGIPFLYQECDVTKPGQIEALKEVVSKKFGKVDFLVNNAGIELCQNLEDYAEGEWEQLLDINLTGAIRMTRSFLSLLPSPGGVVLNVASALGLGGCVGFSVYSASKAGLNGFTQSLAWELGPKKIRVVAVAPGIVTTPMAMRFAEECDSREEVEQLRKDIDACHPLGVGAPHDVANAVAFLVSDDASWITGVTLPLGWAPHYDLPMHRYV
ncbi:SDR family oxidoreductase [Bremerella cremea]|uniref:SDR family NAD(P)-dependent oxidoreductase n=1 Tax=Bremerella cremea TaxID=1031537 RepID=UPI0031EF037F